MLLQFVLYLEVLIKMQTITEEDQLVELLKKQRATPQESQTPSFKGVEFECGCGHKHLATETGHFMCGGLNEFFFICEQEFVSLVKFKGFFSVTPITRWTCEHSIYQAALDKLNN
tara:strand:- start:673 stop:1017 length:345 start_codon:yes stop_codon:yes gene_type:complete